MKTPTHSFMRMRLEMGLIAFFILAALSLLVVYVVSPTIYAQSLSLKSPPVERYSLPVTLFIAAILALITLLIIGVVRHWRWVFWIMLAAFAGSAIQIPITLVQMTGVLPTPYPLWYNLFRLVAGVVELTLAFWMIHIYRHNGVWGQGKKRNER